MSSKVIKFGGLALSIVGAGISVISDHIRDKKIVADLANSKEVKELIAKEVAKALSK